MKELIIKCISDVKLNKRDKALFLLLLSLNQNGATFDEIKCCCGGFTKSNFKHLSDGGYLRCLNIF